MEMITGQGRDWKPRQRPLAGRLLLTILLLHLMFVGPAVQSQTYTVLHRFTGKGDGKYPQAGVILDPLGNVYGTTSDGGAFNFGVAFKVDAQGKETVLHSFWGGDGLGPEGALIRNQAGVLYGTTQRVALQEEESASTAAERYSR